MSPSSRAVLERPIVDALNQRDWNLAVVLAFDLYGAELRRKAKRALLDSQDADDAYSGFRVVVVEAVPSFRQGSLMRTWLHRMFERYLWRCQRAIAKRRWHLTDVDQIASESIDSATESEWEEQLALLREWRSDLSPDDRTLLTARTSGKSYRRIALELWPDLRKKPKGLIKARDRLRKRFQRIIDKLSRKAKKPRGH